MSRVPEEVIERCKTDAAFRAVVVRQFETAIEEARLVEQRLTEDLTRISNACCEDVAQSATK